MVHTIVTGSTSTREFALDILAPAEIRRFVRSQLDDWQLDRLGEVAELLVSEVVTNAIRHALAGGRVTVERTDRSVKVAVTDTGVGTPEQRQAEPHELTGRGLAIVDALAARWGVVEDEAQGKTVWFELDLTTRD